MYPIYIGLFTEGNTDIRFLEPIVEKTILATLLQYSNQDLDITIIPIIIDKKGKGFSEQILDALSIGYQNFGINMLCVQADADNRSLRDTYNNKINKIILSLSSNTELDCKIVIPLVPIQETEAWMLADKELLKLQIGTTKSDTELGINRPTESIANPKEVIENAIRIARSDLTKKRRRDLNISQIYSIIGQSLDISKLEPLESFQDFKSNIIKACTSFGIIHS